MLLYLNKMGLPTTEEYLSFILLTPFLTSFFAISPCDSLSCLWVRYVLCPPFTPPGLSPLLPHIFSRSKTTISVSNFSGNCAPLDFSITCNLCFPIKTKGNFLLVWRSADRASWKIIIIKPTRCTNCSNLFLE